LQGFVSLRPFVYVPEETVVLWRRSAFESYLWSPNRLLGAAFEYRSEGVGCYAPFFHLRLSGMLTHDLAARAMGILPQTVAGGLAVSTNASIFFQYGILISLAADGSANDVFGSNVIHRFRVGLDWSN